MTLSLFAVLYSEKNQSGWLGSSGVWGFRSRQIGQAVALMVRLNSGQIQMAETEMLSLLVSLDQSIRWGLTEPGFGDLPIEAEILATISEEAF